MRIRPLFNYHGGKYYLAPWIISFFPVHTQYVEPFCGGCNVFLQKNSVTSILNDLDYNIFNLLQICQCNPLVLQNELLKLKYDQATFNYLKSYTPNNILDCAVKEFAVRRMSRGGLSKDFGWSNRLRGGRPEYLNKWFTAIEHIKVISDKLQIATITNSSYTDTARFDSPDTLFYLDPPYLTQTRHSKKIYRHEMTDEEHNNMLDWAMSLKGKVVISGYYSKLYNFKLVNWNKQVKNIKNSASQTKVKPLMQECIWMNY